MVEGAKRSRSMKRVAKRIPSGKSVLTFRRAKPDKPTCPTGRELPGTARGNKTEVRSLTHTQRRPSRPYGGVLSSPATRRLLREKASKQASESPQASEAVFEPGAVCMKIAGRDAGKLCVVTEKIDGHYVKIDGFTRPRKCSMKHLEPVGKRLDLGKVKDSKAIQAALKE